MIYKGHSYPVWDVDTRYGNLAISFNTFVLKKMHLEMKEKLIFSLISY